MSWSGCDEILYENGHGDLLPWASRGGRWASRDWFGGSCFGMERPMTRLTTPTNDARLAEMAKRHVNALLRQGARGDVLALAWQAFRETVKGRTQ